MWLYQKPVDWSILHQGLSIPVKYHHLIEDFLKSSFEHGSKSSQAVCLDDQIYQVKLTNTNFNLDRFKGHSDIIQLRWNTNDSLAEHLRNIFSESYNKIMEYRKLKNLKQKVMKPDITESIIFEFNPATGIIDIDYISNSDLAILHRDLDSESEVAFEDRLNSIIVDNTVAIESTYAMRKIRKCNYAIVTLLKDLYNYRCQICGNSFEKYNSRYIEAHHIDPISVSFNNNSDNILITCPNHHRAIHSANPEFNRLHKVFIYPNGLQEELLINKHI